MVRYLTGFLNSITLFLFGIGAMLDAKKMQTILPYLFL